MTPTHREPTAEFEHDLSRHPSLGYELLNCNELVRCVEHARPTSLERWHYHNEYEIQLILGARGEAFIGDHHGRFESGHLVLTGPGLRHNWVTNEVTSEVSDARSLVVQFRGEPLLEAMHYIRELEAIRPLLDRASRGIEFFGLSERAMDHFYRIRRCHGLERFAEFMALVSMLEQWTDFRLLSSEAAVRPSGDLGASVVERILNYVHQNHAHPISLTGVAGHVGASKATVSSYFSQTPEGNFATFLTHVRIDKACGLLCESGAPIARICYDVGFNNLASFTRSFQEIKGVTPLEFRQQTTAPSSDPCQTKNP
jgi:AraC-like DNA-binding protein